MKRLLCIVLLAALLCAAGCTIGEEKSTPTKAPTTVKTAVKTTATPKLTAKPAAVATTAVTAVPTPEVTVERNISEGFWCRDTTMNIGKAPTSIRECYKFAGDGTYTWGYSPGKPMGKSPSCSGAPAEPCRYFINSRGQYEVEGGYYYTRSGDYLIDAHDPPYFMWTTTGIE